MGSFLNLVVIKLNRYTRAFVHHRLFASLGAAAVLAATGRDVFPIEESLTVWCCQSAPNFLQRGIFRRCVTSQPGRCAIAHEQEGTRAIQVLDGRPTLSVSCTGPKSWNAGWVGGLATAKEARGGVFAFLKKTYRRRKAERGNDMRPQAEKQG